MEPRTIELHLGQVVPYPPAPDGIGQVDALLRCNVELLYTRRGRVCRKRVAATDVAGWIGRCPLLPGLPQNPLRRGYLHRMKRFQIH